MQFIKLAAGGFYSPRVESCKGQNRFCNNIIVLQMLKVNDTGSLVIHKVGTWQTHDSGPQSSEQFWFFYFTQNHQFSEYIYKSSWAWRESKTKNQFQWKVLFSSVNGNFLVVWVDILCTEIILLDRDSCYTIWNLIPSTKAPSTRQTSSVSMKTNYGNQFLSSW